MEEYSLEADPLRTEYMTQVTRIVTKSGSSILGDWNGNPDQTQFNYFADDVAPLLDSYELIHFSSGAEMFGRSITGNTEEDIDTKRRNCAIGQPLLMDAYIKAFPSEEIAQILFWATASEENYQDYREETLDLVIDLLENSIIPIINGYDTSTREELGRSENDRSAVVMTAELESYYPPKGRSLLLILSENSVMDSFPDGNEIATIYDPLTLADQLGNHTNSHGTGGVAAKLEAAAIAQESGIATVVAPGKYSPDHEDIIQRIIAGDDIGTFMVP